MSLMLDEIEQQPEALERTFQAEIEHFRAFRRRMERKPPSLVVLAARGTSDNAALFTRYLLEAVVGVPVSLAAPSVTTIYGAKVRWENALVVGISQSGESTDTNLVLEAAREQGMLTVGITNEAGSAMTRLVDEVFLVRARRERSVAATKTYTGQLLMGYLLAYALGAPFQPSAIRRLASATAQALKLKEQIGELSERYRYMTDAVVVGRGLNYANAFEFSLKLMETCYVVAERFSGADFIHGPIALVERAFPVFVFAPPGPTFAGNREMLDKLKQLKAETIVISEAAEAKLLPSATRTIRLRAKTPRMAGCPEDLLTPIPYIVPAQLFAAYLAEQKGFNPDQPRTLSKVTKTI
jgi:glucosamine--fructose-6-phosphate aminotransferase (isomerizing)